VPPGTAVGTIHGKEFTAMTIARHRSIRTITAFRAGYLADHPGATWEEASLAYVMQAGRQTVGDEGGLGESVVVGDRGYAAFIDAVRPTGDVFGTPPRGLKWSEAPALMKATLGI
jgi:hypothetical protein